eukprot:6204188-Pleurochrysis_carterae.AAC.3
MMLTHFVNYLFDSARLTPTSVFVLIVKTSKVGEGHFERKVPTIHKIGDYLNEGEAVQARAQNAKGKGGGHGNSSCMCLADRVAVRIR